MQLVWLDQCAVALSQMDLEYNLLANILIPTEVIDVQIASCLLVKGLSHALSLVACGTYDVASVFLFFAIGRANDHNYHILLVRL